MRSCLGDGHRPSLSPQSGSMTDATAEAHLDPRDAEYARTLTGVERDAMVRTVARFRRPDRLRVGDPLPKLDLLRLEDGSRVPLESLVGEIPLVLVFGSF